MKILLRVLGLIVTLSSCASETREVDGVQTRLYVTRNTTDEQVKAVENYFMSDDKIRDWVDFKQVKKMKLDSNSFSFQLYINTSGDSVKDLVSKYKPMTEMLSRDLFNKVPVHIFITDGQFKILTSIKYTDDKMFSKYDYSTDNFKISYPDGLRTGFGKGLASLLVKDNLGLYNYGDTVQFTATLHGNEVTVDIGIDTTKVDVKEIGSKLRQVNELPYSILFDFKKTYMNFNNKTDNKTLLTFKIGE